MIGVWGFQCQGDCLQVYHVPGEDGDSTILENLVEDGTCLRCGGDLRVMLAPPSETIKFEKVAAKEYWNRMNGLGSKEERVFGVEQVRLHLLEYKIVGVELSETETGRCAIRNLTMFSGSHKYKLHFAVGSGEAVIYKITEE